MNTNESRAERSLTPAEFLQRNYPPATFFADAARTGRIEQPIVWPEHVESEHPARTAAGIAVGLLVMLLAALCFLLNVAQQIQ